MQQGLLFDQAGSNEEVDSDQFSVYHHFKSTQLKQNLYTYLLEKNKKSSSDNKTYVLVHSNLLANHLKHHLSQKGLLTYPIYFITFFDLAKMVLSTLDIEVGKPILDKSLSQLKLYELCYDFFNYDVPNSNLNFLKSKAAFINTLNTSYAYLDKNNISTWPNQHEDLQALYKKYQENFSQHYNTQDSFLKYVSSCLSNNPNHTIPHTLLVYGFYDFSPVQFNLLSNIKFKKKSLWLLSDSPAQNLFSHLSMQDLNDKNSSVEKKPITIHACLNEKNELEKLTTLLVKYIYTEPKQLNTVSVLVPNQHYLNICKTLFKQQGIPYYCPINKSIAKSQMGKVLSLLIDYHQSKQEQDDIIKLILDFPGKKKLLIKNEVISLLKKNRIFNQELLQNSKLEQFSYLKQILKGIHDLFINNSSYSGYIKQLVVFLNHFIDENCLSRELEHSLLFDLQKYFNTLESLNTQFKPNLLLFALKQFLLMPSSGESGKKMHESGVYLAPIDYAAFFSFDHVFILGLNQQTFPKPDQALNLLSIEKPDLDTAPIIDHYEKDIAIFKQLVASCSKVDLFHSQHDHLKDQALQQSVVFDYIDYPVVNAHLTNENFSSVLEYEKNNLSLDLQSMHKDQIENFSQKSPWLKQNIHWMQSYLNPETTFDAYSGHLNISDKPRENYSVTALQRYATCPYQYFLHDVLALHTDHWPQDIYGLHPMEKGELLHHVLFLFYKRCLKQKKSDLEQKTIWLKEIFDHLNHKQQTYSLKKPQLWPLEHINLYQRIKSFIAYEHMRNADYVPIALEMRFGSFKSGDEDKTYSRDEPLCIEYKGKKLYFRGKVDRIDIDSSGHYLHVIDYKSGKVSAKNNDFAQGKTIQMAIYLLLCQKQFKHIPLKNMKARMVSVDPKQNFNERYLSGEYLEQHLDDFYQLIFSLGQGIDHGIFFQNPGNNAQHCQFCDYQMICQSNVLKRAQQIQNSSKLKSILEDLWNN
ncbi:PD-(D/E)XK nuclease family protein [bacterium]|nr:PD-(D/E)XK nuclease family protein [bacterium]